MTVLHAVFLDQTYYIVLIYVVHVLIGNSFFSVAAILFWGLIPTYCHFEYKIVVVEDAFI